MSSYKDNFKPSPLKSGIYPSGTSRQVGLDRNDLEKFSLGNWNSIVKNNRTFFSPLSSVADLLDEESGYAGRPIRLGLPGGNSIRYFYQKIRRDYSESSAAIDTDQWWEDRANGEIVRVDEAYIKRLDTGFTAGQDADFFNDAKDWVEENTIELNNVLSDNYGFIQQNNNIEEDLDPTEIPIFIKFEDDVQEVIDEILDRDFQLDSGAQNDPNVGDPNVNVAIFHYFKVILGLPAENILGETMGYSFPHGSARAVKISLTEPGSGDSTGGNEGGSEILSRDANDIYTIGPPFLDESGYTEEDYDLLQSWGHPSYTRNFPLIETNREIDPVDFQVSCFTEEENNLLYYDFKLEKDKFIDTSYPVKVNVGINLFGVTSFDNSVTAGNALEVINLFYTIHTDSGSANLTEILEDSRSPEESVYYYEVVQWGDEETLLSDDAFLNTSYFQLYEMEEYPGYNDFNMKRLNQSQLIYSKPIMVDGELNLSSHVYNTPGVKTLKIIVYRYLKDLSILNETILVTKNININEGTALSQDFEIFGGTDFNFLPLIDKEVIVGGLDSKSKYIKSLTETSRKISEHGSFLDKKSSKESIENFKNGLYGEHPGNLDLGQIRYFSSAIENGINDFINQDNSIVTDIFINNSDSDLKNSCLIEINPEKIEFLSIENTTGNSIKGVLIGDYKLGSVGTRELIKTDTMQTPILENNKREQAF